MDLSQFDNGPKLKEKLDNANLLMISIFHHGGTTN